MTSQYSRLAPERGAGDVSLSHLSRFSSSSSTGKIPGWKLSDPIREAPPVKRGCFGAIKGWWLELGSIVLAFAVLLCTIILLAFYDGKPLSETPRNPSLNTLINIFSTIVAGLIVFVSSEILSQQKWLAMRSRTTLGDFNVVDNASRGLRGATQVLFRPRLGPMAFAGAVATLLAVLIGPMLQETFVVRLDWVPTSDSNSSAPISRFFAPPTNPDLPKLDAGLKGTIINGLSSTNTTALIPNFDCTTGNCTYQAPYTSLGICSACRKLEITKQCSQSGNCNYTLPNGHVMINDINEEGTDFVGMNVSTAFDTATEMATPSDDVTDTMAIMRASVISLTNGPICTTNGSNPECILPDRGNTTLSKLTDNGVIGAYCELAMCSNTYTANITESRVNEKIIATTDARNTSLPQYWFLGSDGIHYDPVILPDECYIDGKAYSLDQYKNSNNNSWTYATLQPTVGNGNFSFSTDQVKVPIDCVFTMSRITYQAFFQFMSGNPFFLDGTLESEANNGIAGGLFETVPNGIASPIQFVNQVLGLDPLFNNGNSTYDTIDGAFDRLASAMTTYLRENSAQKSSDFSGLEAQLATLQPTAPGVLLRAETIVVVQWYWIVLPAVVLAATFIHLVAAIIRGGVRDLSGNSQAHLWKSSSLVPLLVGHKSQLSDSTSALDNPKLMQELKKKSMTLISSKDGWAFVEAEKRYEG